MSSKSAKELAQSYFERLSKAVNPRIELERILTDLNGLVFSSSNKPVDRETKIKILQELERLARNSIGLEKFSESISLDSLERVTKASDNSDILDVISAMKRRV